MTRDDFETWFASRCYDGDEADADIAAGLAATCIERAIADERAAWTKNTTHKNWFHAPLPDSPVDWAVIMGIKLGEHEEV